MEAGQTSSRRLFAIASNKEGILDTMKKLTRREVMKTAAMAGLATLAAPPVNRGRYRLFAASEKQYSARAVELVTRSTVIDMLSPFTLNFPKMNKWFANPETFTEADLQPFKQSGINVFHIGVGMGGPDSFLEVLKFFATWNGFIADHTDQLMRIDSSGDLERVKRSGKIGVLLGLQNSEHFRTPADVTMFHGLGQRVS